MDMGMGYHGKEFSEKPTCPFCGLAVERPKELQTRMVREMPVGSCACGAVYACDVTGRNQGAAFIEALVLGCNMDWDLAWSLFPDEDYLEKIVEPYDFESHSIVPGGSFEGRRIRGALYFIRLVQDIQEVTGQGVLKKLDRATPFSPEPSPEQPKIKPFSKKEIEELVKAYQVDTLLQHAARDKRILRDLQRLLYTGDKLLRLRTAESLGKVSAVIAKREPGAVSGLLQNLLSTLSNPGSSSWGAIDTIGEIIANSPELFAGYIPALFQFLEDDMLRADILKAIGRTAQARPDLIRKTIFRLLPFFGSPDPETRGNTARIFGFLGVPEARNYLEHLLGDEQHVEIYQNGSIEEKTIAQIAAEALEKIRAE